MRRLFRATFRIAVMVAVLAVVRQVLLEREPRRAINGNDPVLGSLDTWPTVPRKS
jgi:hypothetical protein